MNFRILFSSLALSAILLGGFSSCSSDDSDPRPSLPEISKTYMNESFILNGGEAQEAISATIDAKVSGEATITLKNVVIGEPELKLDAKIMSGDGATWKIEEATSENADRIISFEAAVLDGVLNAKATIKIKSDVVGKWVLNRTDPDEEIKQSDVLFNIDSGREDASFMDQMMNGMIPSIVGQLLARAVDDVTVVFQEDGKVNITYVLPEAPAKEQSPTTKVGSTSLPIPLFYYVKDGKVNLAVEESLLDETVPQLIPESLNLNFDDVKALFNKTGLYYSLTLNNELKDNYAQFYVDQSLISKLAPIAIDMIPEDGVPLPSEEGEEPQNLEKEFIVGILNHLKEAKTIKLGLGFNKVAE